MLNNIITGGEDNSIGGVIQSLIQSNMSCINTCFIAKVVSVNNNKVDIIDILKSNINNDNTIIPNVIVGQPYSNKYKISFSINTNDIGIALVCKKDISTYKKNGASSSVVNTNRNFNIIDSIFIPLSLFNQTDLNNDEMFIGNEDNNIKLSNKLMLKSKSQVSIESEQINILSRDNLELKGKLLSLKSENDSLKNILIKLSDLVSNLIIDTPQGVGSINQASKQLIEQWKVNLNNFFKE
mgnify:CR=1 FL=1